MTSKLLWVLLLSIFLSTIHASSSSSSSAMTPTPTPTLSGCQVCAANGDCSHAYLDGPGQFCGNWLDLQSQRQRCCCPHDATCKVSNYACKCSHVEAAGDHGGTVPLWVSVVAAVLSIFAFASFVVCCCWCCCRPHPQPRVEGVYASAPVYAAPGVSYGASYHHAYGNDYGGSDSGTTAAALGVGLLGGLLVGEAIADAGDNSYDGGGGFDSGGDFGGDF